MNINLIKKAHIFLLGVICILFFVINAYANADIDKVEKLSNDILYDNIHDALCVNE